jgi:hypothetical protein
MERYGILEINNFFWLKESTMNRYTRVNKFAKTTQSLKILISFINLCILFFARKIHYNDL